MRWPRLPAIAPIRLRTQLALSMVAAILLAVGFGYVGLTAWGEWLTQDVLNQLSPASLRAYEDIQAARPPDPEDFAAFSAETAPLNAGFAAQQDAALVVLTLIASIVGVLSGIAFASRLSHPLETLAATARAVAAGDLSARARPRVQGAGETAQLISDFNAMADALERADRQLKENSAAIAHELRTPLTVLMGRLQGLEDEVYTADKREIRGLMRHVESLSRIVADLQTLSSAEAGILSLRLEPVDLAAEAREVVRTFGPTLEASGIFASADLQPGLALADPARVRQALLALLENARRHAAEGGAVAVETRSTPRGAILRILDRGPGFPPGAEDAALRPFWRADESRSRDSGGSGLGLAVIAAIMKAHGGRVEIAARPGGGAQITLTFRPSA